MVVLIFPEELLRRGRAGYYGLITYLDEKIGRLLKTLEETGQLENTVVVHTSDHGEMNGEHGMWRKSNFYEASARVPLQIMFPDRLPTGKRIDEVVSLVDLTATLVDIAGARSVGQLDGDSLLPLMRVPQVIGRISRSPNTSHTGLNVRWRCYGKDSYKFNYSLGDAPELYDIAEDPNEFRNLADDEAYQAICQELEAQLLAEWDPVEIEKQVRASQKARILVDQVTEGQWRKPPNPLRKTD